MMISPSPPSTPPATAHSLTCSPSHSSSLFSTPSYREGSELPSLRRQHTTSGYRSGLSAAKEMPEFAQQGFDEGYPVGATLGMQVGFLLGTFEELRIFAIAGEGEAEKAKEELRLEGLMGEMEVGGLLTREGGLGEDVVEEQQLELWKLAENWTETLATIEKWSRAVEEIAEKLNVDFSVQGLRESR